MAVLGETASTAMAVAMVAEASQVTVLRPVAPGHGVALGVFGFDVHVDLRFRPQLSHFGY